MEEGKEAIGVAKVAVHQSCDNIWLREMVIDGDLHLAVADILCFPLVEKYKESLALESK